MPPPWKRLLDRGDDGPPCRRSCRGRSTTPSSDCGVTSCGSSHGDSRRSNGPHSTRAVPSSRSASARARRVELEKAAAVQHALPVEPTVGHCRSRGRSRWAVMSGLAAAPAACRRSAGRRAEVVELPAPRQRGAGEEAREHLRQTSSNPSTLVRTRTCAPARRSAGLEQDLEVARGRRRRRGRGSRRVR